MKLRIEKIVYGGAGLAHSTEESEKTFFVPFSLPGELVEAAPVLDKGSFVDAEPLQILEPSQDRVVPQCVHFGECGGCHLQHAEYKAQLALKVSVLEETLQRSGIDQLPTVQVLAAQPWQYRNRIRLRIAEEGELLRVGYLRRGTNDFLPIRECLIAAPLLWHAATALLSLSEAEDAARWLRAIDEVEFFASKDESMLQMTLYTRQRHFAGLRPLCQRLSEVVPELTGAGVLLLRSRPSRRAERPQVIAGWGADGFSYHAAGERYWVSRGGFFQVNRFLIDDLLHLVTSGRRGKLAWDLYAGVGLFSRGLKAGFGEVVAVEAAADDLVKSFKGDGRYAVSATTIDFLRSAVLQRERPELIVMDPPRAGVGAEVCALLDRIGAKEMIYVSCDPVTLGRDLKAMVDFGYRIDELHMVDMFPQTYHQETVAVLRRS
ncbi:MAG TPA: 23S rRNA (uracil(1939)-C(5))-methyltransferase RlmD [Edaphobacter sp.]|nr:23S rRNA (uracil(1939)-C(5))-methyltransferase RlmD [Edaphobacter sp.]